MKVNNRTVRMHSLASLPSEILDQITHLCSTYKSIVMLWKTGNRLLQRRLSQGCTKVDLPSMVSLECPAPRMLLELQHLRHLTFESHEKLMKSDPKEGGWNHFLSALPRTLESLFISSADAGEALVVDGAVGVSPPLFALDKVLPKLSVLGIHPLSGSIPSGHLSCLPVSLKTLSANIRLDYHFNPANMSLLPKSLTCIDGNVVFAASADSRGNSIFPPLKVVTEDWLLAPPNLTSIEHILYPSQLSASHLCWLPRSLTRCRFNESMRWSKGLVSDLPEGLQRLDVHKFDRNLEMWTKELPRNLVSFKVSSCDHYQLEKDSISYLPRSLTHLDLPYAKICWNSLQAADNQHSAHTLSLDVWPPLLLKLNIRNAHTPIHMIDLLPKTLTKLALSIPLSMNDEDEISACTLPPALTWLEIGGIGPIIKGHLPTSLHTLILDLIYYTEETIEFFPPSLSTMRLERAGFAIDNWLATSKSLFPEGLKTASFNRLSWHAFKLLPRSITDLSANILDFDVATGKNYDDMFAGLPPALTALKLDNVLSSDFIPTLSTQSLPQTITDLQIRRFAYFDSSMLRELPTDLKLLDMSIGTVSKEDLPFLPRNLTKLSISGPDDLTPFIPYWPLKCASGLPHKYRDEFKSQHLHRACDS